MLHIPPISSVDGIALDGFEVGQQYEVGNSLAALFLAEGWAIPVPLESSRAPEAFGPDDPFGLPTLDRNSPPNLVKEHIPPYLPPAIAADIRRRRRRRS
jgi:hypothetical protein